MIDQQSGELSPALTALVQRYGDLIARNAKASIFRALTTEITEAFKYGHTRLEIWEALTQAGYHGSYPTFCRVFRRTMSSIGFGNRKDRKGAPAGRESQRSQMSEVALSSPPLVETTGLVDCSPENQLSTLALSTGGGEAMATVASTISSADALNMTPDQIRALDWMTRSQVVSLRAKAMVEENRRREAEAAERDKTDFHFDPDEYWESVKKIYGKVKP